MYLTIEGGGDLSHKNMQYNYSKKMFSRRAKPIRIIGNPDNQRPDKWSYTAIVYISHIMKSHKTAPHQLVYLSLTF